MTLLKEFQDFLKYFEKTNVGMPKIVSKPGEIGECRRVLKLT